jgi:hypothetical protein
LPNCVSKGKQHHGEPDDENNHQQGRASNNVFDQRPLLLARRPRVGGFSSSLALKFKVLVRPKAVSKYYLELENVRKNVLHFNPLS